jgi:hypothetical protein
VKTVEIISKIQKGIHDGIFWAADKVGHFIGDNFLHQATKHGTTYAIVKAAPMVVMGMKVCLIIIAVGFILVCIGMPKTALKCIGMGSISYILLSLV